MPKPKVLNKLDAVSEIYPSVADLVLSTTLKNNTFVSTLGYYSPNDGGSATYMIKMGNLVEDKGSVINLSSGLQALLVVEDSVVNIRQFGAKGDGVTDDYSAIQKAITFSGGTYAVYIPDGTFNCTSPISITRQGTIIRGAGTSLSKLAAVGTNNTLLTVKANYTQYHNLTLAMSSPSDLVNEQVIVDMYTPSSMFNEFNKVKFEKRNVVGSINTTTGVLSICKVKAVKIKDGYFTRITDCIFDSAYVSLVDQNNQPVLHPYVLTKQAVYPTMTGIYSDNCNSLYIAGNTFYKVAEPIMLFNEDGAYIAGNHFENFCRGITSNGTCYNNTFIGNRYETHSIDGEIWNEAPDKKYSLGFLGTTERCMIHEASPYIEYDAGHPNSYGIYTTVQGFYRKNDVRSKNIGVAGSGKIVNKDYNHYFLENGKFDYLIAGSPASWTTINGTATIRKNDLPPVSIYGNYRNAIEVTRGSATGIIGIGQRFVFDKERFYTGDATIKFICKLTKESTTGTRKSVTGMIYNITKNKWTVYNTGFLSGTKPLDLTHPYRNQWMEYASTVTIPTSGTSSDPQWAFADYGDILELRIMSDSDFIVTGVGACSNSTDRIDERYLLPTFASSTPDEATWLVKGTEVILDPTKNSGNIKAVLVDPTNNTWIRM
ncbi:hypothetical protein CEW46_21255 [Bacillus cereus]|nr:hypothetical protein CEW46_21255 [Bacillus cereus]